jgi:hypothetical protein
MGRGDKKPQKENDLKVHSARAVPVKPSAKKIAAAKKKSE